MAFQAPPAEPSPSELPVPTAASSEGNSWHKALAEWLSAGSDHPVASSTEIISNYFGGLIKGDE